MLYRKLAGFLMGAAALMLSMVAQAADTPVKMKFCVFDILGKQGDVYNYAKDMVLEARRFGFDITLQVYTDERIASEDFKAGQCDGVTMPTLRARQFNKFAGSLDSVGSIPTYEHLKTVMSVIHSDKMAPKMITGKYQIVGIVPIGAVFVMVRDRAINSVEKAAGKKVAVLEWDKSQASMVQKMGAQPVASDITNFAGKFNNGQVDIIAAPAIAIKPMELYKGLGTKGAIYRFPLAMITGAVVINREKLLAQAPDLDARIAKLRSWALAQAPKAYQLIAQSEKEVDPKYWMDLTPADKDKYTRMMREARILLTKEGVYDPEMMKLLKRVRCKHDPANAECTMTDE